MTIVVNYDLPVDLNRRADCETYLHRIGRTGRFGKSGLTINLIDGPESMAVMKDIENHFGASIFFIFFYVSSEVWIEFYRLFYFFLFLGRKITQLDCENVDEIEKLAQDG